MNSAHPDRIAAKAVRRQFIRYGLLTLVPAVLLFPLGFALLGISVCVFQGRALEWIDDRKVWIVPAYAMVFLAAGVAAIASPFIWWSATTVDVKTASPMFGVMLLLLGYLATRWSLRLFAALAAIDQARPADGQDPSS